MDISFFTGIAGRLDKPRDSRLSYSTRVHPVYAELPGGSIRHTHTMAAILLHGAAGTVDFVWMKPSDDSETLSRPVFPEAKWWELGALSLGWHSRTPVPADCHRDSCVVLKSGPWGDGPCWHDYSYMDGLELGPVIDASAWATLSGKLEAAYNRLRNRA